MPAENDAFHAGEQAVQERLGVREKMALRGVKVIRDRMPDQHRDFFALLPTLFVAAIDSGGQVWATMVAGEPGFVSSPLPTRLEVAAFPDSHDPVAACLHDGARIGLLGLDFATRRRNRMNGYVRRGDTRDAFAVEVEQSFGNCPKYIQTRHIDLGERRAGGQLMSDEDRLDHGAAGVIAAADTFFVATAAPVRDDERRHGLDISHRGGIPGFVEILDQHSLRFPDYPGNLFFNTLGNIVENPRLGLLFVDFNTGDLIQLAGTAVIDWESPHGESIGPRIERWLRVRVDRVIRRWPGQRLRASLLAIAPEFI